MSTDIVALLIGITLIDVIFITIAQSDRLDFFNPVINYKLWTSMNWFGVLIFTILLNVLCPVIAVGYWFYKLCTVGRKR